MNIELNGAEAVQKVFSGLSEPLKTKVLKKALMIMAKPIIDSAKEKVWTHQRKGRLYRSLGTQAKLVNGSPIVILGAKKTGRFKGYHAHFLENGTEPRSYITKTGVRKSTGRVKGIKFWSRSVDEGSNKSENDFYSYIVIALEKEVNTLYRKSKK